MYTVQSAYVYCAHAPRLSSNRVCDSKLSRTYAISKPIKLHTRFQMPYQKQPKPSKKLSTNSTQRKSIVARQPCVGAQINRESAIEALHACNGVVSYAAERLGCNRNTLHNLIKRDPEVAQAYKDARERLIDMVEDTYIQKAINGDSYNGTFLLRTIGRERGYEYDHKEANLALVQISRYIMNKTQAVVVPENKNNQLVQDDE